MSPFKKFIKQFSHFFGGMVSVQLLSFVTFPILTRVLTKEQYGILGLVTTTMLFAIAIAKAGLSDGVIRFYKEYSGDRKKLETFSSTVLMRGIIFSVLTCLLYLIVLFIFWEYFKLNGKYILCLLIMVLYLLIRPLNIIVLYFLRVNDKTIFINIVNLVERISSVGLSLFLFLYVFKTFYGYFVGLVIAEGVVSIVLFYWFFRHFSLNPTRASKELNLQLIKFGGPLLLSELTFLLMSYADRYLVVTFLGEGALGLYSAGYNVAMYIGNIIMFSLSYAIVPIYVEIYGAEGREQTEIFLKRCMRYLLMTIIPMWFGYVAISKDLFITLASEKYVLAAKFSPLILLAYFLSSVNAIFRAGLYLEKKTMISFLITFSAIILNICLNLILLKKMELMGASIAALVSSIVSTILIMIVSNRYIKVEIEVWTFIYYVGLSCLMMLVLNEIETGVVWENLILKIILGAVLIGLGILFKENEIRENIKKVYKLRISPLLCRRS